MYFLAEDTHNDVRFWGDDMMPFKNGQYKKQSLKGCHPKTIWNIIWRMFPVKTLDNYFCKNINWRNKEFNILRMEKSLNMSGNETTKSYPWKKSGNKISNLVHGKFQKTHVEMSILLMENCLNMSGCHICK